jgi:hypothetical protein
MIAMHRDARCTIRCTIDADSEERPPTYSLRGPAIRLKTRYRRGKRRSRNPMLYPVELRAHVHPPDFAS